MYSAPRLLIGLLLMGGMMVFARTLGPLAPNTTSTSADPQRAQAGTALAVMHKCEVRLATRHTQDLSHKTEDTNVNRHSETSPSRTVQVAIKDP